MEEANVRLLCPECNKGWENTPRDLPGHSTTFDCPGCQASRPLAEFMRTGHDLRTLKKLS